MGMRMGMAGMGGEKRRRKSDAHTRARYRLGGDPSAKSDRQKLKRMTF